MAKQTINVGSTANDGTGDKLRDAFVKVNANFTELYSDDAGDVNSVNAGTGISVDQTTGAVTVTNSAPDQTVSLADGGNIGISGTYPSFTLTNSAPDQTVSLADGGDIAVSGTYPSFTLTNSAPNATHTGEVTGSGALTIANGAVTNAKMAVNSVDSDQYVDGSIDTVHLANDVVTYDKLGAEFTTSAAVGATTLDFSTAQVFTKANSGTVTYTITNADTGMVKDLILTGTGSFSITGGKLVAGSFVESVTNFIQIVAQSSSIFWYSISQEQ